MTAGISSFSNFSSIVFTFQGDSIGRPQFHGIDSSRCPFTEMAVRPKIKKARRLSYQRASDSFNLVCDSCRRPLTHHPGAMMVMMMCQCAVHKSNCKITVEGCFLSIPF